MDTEMIEHDAHMLIADLFSHEVPQRSGGDVLLELVAVRAMMAELEATKAHLARVAYYRGHTWGEVGAALQITKQAASKRFREA